MDKSLFGHARFDNSHLNGRGSGNNRRWLKETNEIHNEKLLISSEKIKRNRVYDTS